VLAEPTQDDDSRGSSSARQVPAEHQTTSKRLTSISSFGPGSSSTKETKRAKSRSSKSAQEIIREATSSGEIRLKTEQGGSTPTPPTAPAMRAPPPPSSAVPLNKNAKTNGPLPTFRFLKPAGVDEPSDNPARGDGSRPAQPGADMSHGTRGQNLKRERDDHHEASAQTADRKRKKSGAAAAA